MIKIFSLLVFSFFVIFILASGVKYKNTPDDIGDDCRIPNTAFRSGEKIVFKAYYNWKFVWIPAGEAEFIIQEKEDSYHITVTGKTYRSYDVFFRVRDYFHSVIDKRTLYPRTFVRSVEEGRYRRFDSISFNQSALTATSYNGKTRESAIRKNINLSECTHDLLSVFYFLRNMNVAQYRPGDMVPTRILFDETIYPIKVRYEGKYDDFEIKDLGTYNTLKIIPDLVTGNVFKEGNLMQIWVTNDANKLPLLVESPLTVGSAKAVLKSYSGLRYALNER
jgi:hypothetical protein